MYIREAHPTNAHMQHGISQNAYNTYEMQDDTNLNMKNARYVH
jgi:hypothetical protein